VHRGSADRPNLGSLGARAREGVSAEKGERDVTVSEILDEVRPEREPDTENRLRCVRQLLRHARLERRNAERARRRAERQMAQGLLKETST
jgi:hypothetical protein